MALPRIPRNPGPRSEESSSSDYPASSELRLPDLGAMPDLSSIVKSKEVSLPKLGSTVDATSKRNSEINDYSEKSDANKATSLVSHRDKEDTLIDEESIELNRLLGLDDNFEDDYSLPALPNIGQAYPTNQKPSVLQEDDWGDAIDELSSESITTSEPDFTELSYENSTNESEVDEDDGWDDILDAIESENKNGSQDLSEDENDTNDEENENFDGDDWDLIDSLDDVQQSNSRAIEDDEPADKDEEDWDDILSSIASSNLNSDEDDDSEENDEDSDDDWDFTESDEYSSEDEEAITKIEDEDDSYATSDEVESTDESDDDEEDYFNEDEEEFIPPDDPFATVKGDSRSSDNEESESFEPEAEEKKDEKKDKPKKKSSISEKIASKIPEDKKGKFDSFLKQVKAELKGKDAPSEDEDEEDAEDEARRERKQAKRSSGSNAKGLFKILALPKKAYLWITNMLFSILKTVLGILGSIPLIGWPFKQALKFVKVIEILAKSLPIVILIATLVIISYFSIPRETTVELPDSGLATAKSVSYDSDTQEVVGTIINQGETFADITPTVTVWSIQPGINPGSWFMPKEVRQCTGVEVSVDIDGESEFRVSCSGDITGFFPRASAVME